MPTNLIKIRKSNSIPSYIEQGNDIDAIVYELQCIDILIRICIQKHKQFDKASQYDAFRGLVISDEEIEGLIADANYDVTDDSLQYADNVELSALKKELADLEINNRKYSNCPLSHLVRVYKLTPLEERCLIICLAPELEKRYEKLYSYIHDDVTRKQPSPGLILDLLCNSFHERIEARKVFDPAAPLFKHRLLYFAENSGETPSILSRPLKIDERVVSFLLGFPGIDSRLLSTAQLLPCEEKLDLITLPEDTVKQLRSFVLSHSKGKEQGDGNNLMLYFYGPYGTGKISLAKAICRDLGLSLLVADIGRLIDGPLLFEEGLKSLCREALLQPAALCLNDMDHFLADDSNKFKLGFLVDTLKQSALLTFFIGGKSWKPQGLFGEDIFLPVEFPLPDEKARKRFWEIESKKSSRLDDGIDFGELAGKFHFSPGLVRDAVIAAGHSADRAMPNNPQVTKDNLYAACRDQSNAKLSILARKIEPKYGWDDIVLPDDQKTQLKELYSHAGYRSVVYGEWGFNKKLSYGKGLNVLFSGPPGTGKTMAAEVVARELKLDLYKIDLSQVVSKYIGETEKNLDKIFTEARTSNAILFFDEADALFGKRSEVKDAHDRYANIEISYLLQKMEEYDGIAILATNLRSNIDEAFVRRMRFMIEFPLPGVAERRLIWEKVWPEESPRHSDINLELLTKRFEITGGSIRNIALAAAFMAADEGGAIEMKHLFRATRREFQKMGKIVSASDFGM